MLLSVIKSEEELSQINADFATYGVTVSDYGIDFNDHYLMIVGDVEISEIEYWFYNENEAIYHPY